MRAQHEIWTQNTWLSLYRWQAFNRYRSLQVFNHNRCRSSLVYMPARYVFRLHLYRKTTTLLGIRPLSSHILPVKWSGNKYINSQEIELSRGPTEHSRCELATAAPRWRKKKWEEWKQADLTVAPSFCEACNSKVRRGLRAVTIKHIYKAKDSVWQEGTPYPK